MSQQVIPQRILCVCLGNICRSPTAEAVFSKLLQQNGLNIEVDSAGTSNYHPNKAPDSRSIECAKNHGFDLSRLRARQIQPQDLREFDLILAMDRQNLKDLKYFSQRWPAQHTQKNATLALLTEHDVKFNQQDVPDPYYGEQADFELVVKQCQSSAQSWINYWMRINPNA